MGKRCLCLMMFVFMLASCTSYKSMMHADDNMRKVRLGMTKEQVISVMGKGYEVISFKEEMFTLGYKSYDDGIYKLLFKGGKLQEWNKEWFRGNYIIQDETGKVTTPSR